MELTSVPGPSKHPSSSLLSDSAPPTYHEATDPSFGDKLQKFAKNPIPQWPGFHPTRLHGQMSRQFSRTSQAETGELATQDGDVDGCCKTMIIFSLMGSIFSAVAVFIAIPVAMIVVGALFYEECSVVSPYPMWLVVGGSAIIVTILFTICLMVTEAKNMGLYCILMALLIFPIIWYFFGCWYLWAIFTRNKQDRTVTLIYGPDWVPWEDFKQTDCIYPYWAVFGLVVSPLALIGLAVGIGVLAVIILCFSTSIDDDEES